MPKVRRQETYYSTWSLIGGDVGEMELCMGTDDKLPERGRWMCFG